MSFDFENEINLEIGTIHDNNSNHTEDHCLKLANELIYICSNCVPVELSSLKSIRQLNGSFYIKIFETLYETELPGFN
jgi:hypothetical protein